MSDQSYLAHHGIKGMKWGVRRYQNYDGSYTQAGMRRYRSSMDNYEKQNERYKSLKNSGASKADITNAKLSRKKAKRQVEKDYKHLRQDKLGDKGKELYARGKTITGNAIATKALSAIGSMSLTAAYYSYMNGANAKVVNALSAIGGVSLASAAGKSLVDASQNRKLRAYYSHTSNY